MDGWMVGLGFSDGILPFSKTRRIEEWKTDMNQGMYTEMIGYIYCTADMKAKM
jgi:hypothetical protein